MVNSMKFEDYFNEQMKDPKMKKEWDDIQPEMDVIRAMIKARNEQNLTQKELADRIGMNLSLIHICAYPIDAIQLLNL